MRALLDINVVIALLDAEHVMHTQATQWLARELDNGWASCPVTQNGVLRILSQPAYPNHRPADEVADAYLLSVAMSEGGRFVSFDQRIPMDLVPQARPDQLVALGVPQRQHTLA